jgi:hypothetical protein
MKIRSFGIPLILLSLLLSSCAGSITPTAPAVASNAAAQPTQAAAFEPLGAASAKRATQVFPIPGEANAVAEAWKSYDGMIMMEDQLFFDRTAALHWTSTVPDTADYACSWTTVTDPTCQMVQSHGAAKTTLLTVAGLGDIYLGVAEAGKFNIYAGTAPTGQPLLTADLPQGAKVRNFTFFPEAKTAALHVQLADPSRETLLVVGAAAGAPYEIGFCMPFNASIDPSKNIPDQACVLSKDGKYQLGRADVPEIIETAGGTRVSLLTPEILNGFPDMNSLIAWPNGKTLSYANQITTARNEISEVDLLKFDLEKHQLAGSVKLALPAEDLNTLKTDYALSSDGTLLAISDLANNILLIDTSNGAVLKTLKFNSPASRLAFSLEGNFLAAGFYNRQIVLFGAPKK